MSENLIERREEDGLVVSTYYDCDGGSYADPRDHENLSVLYCWHPDYVLGDEQFGRGDHESMEAVVEYLRTERKATIIVPLFLLDHSGISMNTGPAIDWSRYDEWSCADIESRGRFVGDEAGWDTTHVGYAYTTDELVAKLGVTGDAETLQRYIVEEVQEYDRFLRGEVYGYVIEDEAGDTIDSCWGFLGHEYFEGEVERQVEYAKGVRDRERSEADYWRARDVETVAA